MRITALAAALALPMSAQAPDPALFKGDPKAAMLICAEKARSLKPRKAEVLASAGRASLAAGDKAKAEEAFKAALSADADDPEAHLVILSSWLDFGFKAEALGALQRIRDQYPRSEKVPGWKNCLAKMAAALVTGNLAAEAEETMQAAYAKGPKDWQNMTFFGRACLRAGKPELAAKWFSLAVKSAPKDESIWNDIALSLADQGREN